MRQRAEQAHTSTEPTAEVRLRDERSAFREPQPKADMNETRKRRYTIACLAGDGIGPELMAEASRAILEVSRLHGFTVAEVHAPFGGDATRRFGHALPAETRAACRNADAVLVAATKEPALEGVKAELDLTWRVQRVRMEPSVDLTVVSPLVEGADEATIERAFAIARTRRARIASVGSRAEWHALVEEAADRHAGVLVEELPLEEALPLVVSDAAHFDVIVSERMFAEGLSNMAAFGDPQVGSRIVASGRLSEDGQGIFGPTHSSALEIAGLGVANPSGMLLAAALMLAEGLAQRAAAQTLEGAVTEALRSGTRTPDLVHEGVAATTREFVDVVLSLLPGARTDTEFSTRVLV
jgi:3-isopropylmalate dehydrogenase